MPNPQCEQVRAEYENLKALKREFDLEYEKAVETGNLERVKELQALLEQKRDALVDKLWIFEALPQKELKKQYESQRAIFQRNGILEQLPNGELGIKAIDGKEYPFPSLQEIQRAMREQRKILKPKMEQGFRRLLIVPFGMKLDDLIEKYRQVILKHHRAGTLLATKENPTDPDEPLKLNKTEPVWVWDDYNNADVEGRLVYFHERFDFTNHQGKTKLQLLQEQGGFNILFIEDLPNIPRSGKGQEIKGRKQLETGKTATQYLETLKTNPQYKNETGMTPEEQITYAIQHLEETNQVIDDCQGRGSISYQLGAYFPVSSDDVPDVPVAYWCRDNLQAILSGYDLEVSRPGSGARSAVRVKIKT